MPTARLSAASACLFLLAVLPCAARAQDYVQSPRTYYLHTPSSYQQGCWGNCDCPLAFSPMRGSFTLSLITVGDVTDFYSISNIAWTVAPFAGQTTPTTITGSGTFAAGQVPYATHQHASLDVTLTPAPSPWTSPQHFDTTPEAGTRSVPPPVIDIEVANNTTGCPGIRLRIVASWFRSDFDASGAIAVLDIFTFLNTWFAGDLAADFDNSGTLSTQDIFDYLNAWFAGV